MLNARQRFGFGHVGGQQASREAAAAPPAPPVRSRLAAVPRRPWPASPGRPPAAHAQLSSALTQRSRITAGLCSMPVFKASAPRSPSTTSICWVMKSSGTPWMSWTPKCVLCAVRAVMAVMAKPPKRRHGLDVRLNPGAAAAIRAGNDQHASLSRGIPLRSLESSARPGSSAADCTHRPHRC